LSSIYRIAASAPELIHNNKKEEEKKFREGEREGERDGKRKGEGKGVREFGEEYLCPMRTVFSSALNTFLICGIHMFLRATI